MKVEAIDNVGFQPAATIVVGYFGRSTRPRLADGFRRRPIRFPAPSDGYARMTP